MYVYIMYVCMFVYLFVCLHSVTVKVGMYSVKVPTIVFMSSLETFTSK